MGRVQRMIAPVDVTLSLTEYLGVVTGTFTATDGTTGSIEDGGRRLSGGYFGGLPCVGPLNAFFVVDRP